MTAHLGHEAKGVDRGMIRRDTHGRPVDYDAAWRKLR